MSASLSRTFLLLYYLVHFVYQGFESFSSTKNRQFFKFGFYILGFGNRSPISIDRRQPNPDRDRVAAAGLRGLGHSKESSGNESSEARSLRKRTGLSLKPYRRFLSKIPFNLKSQLVVVYIENNRSFLKTKTFLYSVYF